MFGIRTNAKFLAVAVVIAVALVGCYLGLTSVLGHHDDVYMLILLDAATAVAYVFFAVTVIANIRNNTYSKATATAVTYGVLTSFLGILVAVAATYYVLGSQWSDQLVDGDQPREAFSRIDAVYFAATVFTTVGFGDVHAVGELARLVVTGQMLFTYVYAVTALTLITSAALM